MNEPTSGAAERLGGLARFADGTLVLPDLALLTITGGDPAARDRLARALAADGRAVIAPTTADAAATLAERRAVILDIAAPGQAREAGHAARDRVFRVARQAHVDALALEPGAAEARVRALAKAGFADAVAPPPDGAVDRVVYRPLPVDFREDQGPFDVIGDVHGCAEELRRLLERLGHGDARTSRRSGRRLLFVGDLCDRGPENVEVLRIVMDLVEKGRARMAIGNHDDKLLRHLRGRDVSLSHGLAATVEELRRESAAFRDEVAAFLAETPSHLWLDSGRLVVAHAGLKQDMHGRDVKAVRSFAMYGETTGERDEYGLPIRLDWGRNYRGAARVVYGHTPVATPGWSNGALCIDTGCVFGGMLTAYRWPEETFVTVPARRVHYAPPRPLAPPTRPAALTND